MFRAVSKKVMFSSKMSIALASILALASNASMSADEKPEFTDYCDRLEQEIQGKKHGFLAGNITDVIGDIS